MFAFLRTDQHMQAIIFVYYVFQQVLWNRLYMGVSSLFLFKSKKN